MRSWHYNTGNNFTDLAMLTPVVVSLTEDKDEIGFVVLVAGLSPYTLGADLIHSVSV